MEEKYMQRAIDIAKKGAGFVSPNPMVGAVIVKDGRIISEGYHQKYGEYHAERNALLSCKENLNGADMYVTLEPCCHHGKTPPCTEIIIESGIKRVFVGCTDDNPKVNNRGIDILRENGVEVITGLLQNECRTLNEIFFHYINTKTPFVVLKYATTADGKICTITGESKWITSEPARENVHRTRGELSAIMVGVETIIKDDPMLNCRVDGYKNPVRIICDSNLRIPIMSNIVTSAKDIKTIIATLEDRNFEKKNKLQSYGIEILETPASEHGIDLNILMSKLGKKNIDSLMLEGGATLNFSALKSGIVNKIQAYTAPKIFGGQSAKTPVEGVGIADINECINLKISGYKLIGKDLLIEYDVEMKN